MAKLSSNFASFDEMLRPLMGILGVVFALIATVTAVLGDTPADDAGSSRADGYVSPGFEDSVNLGVIRGEFFYAVNEVRANEEDPVVKQLQVDIDLQNQAQRHAEGNAATGTYAKPSEIAGDLGVLQADIPSEQASGHTLMQAFLNDQASSDYMVDPRHTHLGVGVAQGHGRVWIVVAFSRQ